MPLDALAAWHQPRIHLAINAMMAARAAAPHLAGLVEFLIGHMPRKPLASMNIRSVGVRDRTSDPTLLDDAALMPWVAFDAEGARNVIAIDIDHADGPERADRLAAYGLPRPTLILDPWSGRAHAVWRLATPVLTGEGARTKPQKLLAVAGSLLAAAMDGTLLPPRALLKSPWGRLDRLQGQRLRRGPTPAVPALWDAYTAAGSALLWHTIPGDPQAVELRAIVAALLDDFGDALADPVRRWTPRRPPPSALGRNCELFDRVRWWAYDRIERDGTAIRDEAVRVNAIFAAPLPANEVAGIARSIARFMHTRYGRRRAASHAPRRDDAAGSGMTAQQKRALSGRASADAVIARTNAMIARGLAGLRAVGARVTQAALAAAAGVSVRTIASRWATLERTAAADAPEAPIAPCKAVRVSGLACAPGPRSGPTFRVKNLLNLPFSARARPSPESRSPPGRVWRPPWWQEGDG